MWKQRSKSFWYQNGDRNTRFFHTLASQRRQKNRIMGLEDNSGVWQRSDEDIQSIVLNYFSSIYQSDQPSQFSLVIDAIEKRVTDEMNDSLLKEFQPDEVQLALHQMHPTKSPGPDGMPPLFFQKYWSIIGQDVIDCVLNILNTSEMPLKLNDTYICLIPKTKIPKKSLTSAL